MRKNNNYLNDLIKEGQNFNFNNNRKIFSYDGTSYSDASNDLMSWISKVEDYIRSNYDDNSGPVKMIESVKKEKFNGYHQSEFETELKKLQGAIMSCERILPNKKKDDNYILSLIKNPVFWTILVVVIGDTYKLGHDIGESKFGNEKIEQKKAVESQEKEITRLKGEAASKDSLINILNKKKEIIPLTTAKKH